MITLIVASAELERIKTLLKKEVKVLRVVKGDQISSITVLVDGVPFELSPEECLASVKTILCENGEYTEVEISDQNKVCVMSAFDTESSIISLAKK